MAGKLVLGLALLVAGCAGPVADLGPSAPMAPQGRAERQALECKMLVEGYARMQSLGRSAPQDILTGCPGHESARDQMPLRAQTAALRRANAAAVPAQAQSPFAARAYRRAISRGLPEEITRDLALAGYFAGL